MHRVVRRYFRQSRGDGNPVNRKQGGDMRMGAHIARLARAIEFAAALWARLVDCAAAGICDVRAAPINERQDRSVIQQNAAMPGATRAFTLNAWQVYHNSRAD